MPVMAQYDSGIPDSVYFLEPRYEPDGCSGDIIRIVPLHLFTDFTSILMQLEFSWEESDLLDTVLFYPPFLDSPFTTIANIDNDDRYFYGGIARLNYPSFPPTQGIIAELVFRTNLGDTLWLNRVANGFVLTDWTIWEPLYCHLDTMFVTPDTILVFAGDADASTEVDIDDVVYLLNYIFAGGCPPWDLNSGDADQSCGIDIDDVVYLIEFIFVGGPAPLPGCVR
jgi:hypothetical protein